CLFFQAEDGIRDRNVTGVQTCALPIFLRIGSHSGISLINFSLKFLYFGMHVCFSSFLVKDGVQFVQPGQLGLKLFLIRKRLVYRSEERRVGKEWRSSLL